MRPMAVVNPAIAWSEGRGNFLRESHTDPSPGGSMEIDFGVSPARAAWDMARLNVELMSRY
jgi:hypothetical protein